jgi:hypothetical protein
MDDQFDVYSPPKAAIEPQASAALASDALYVVSPFKFSLLFLATLGIYQVYWFYRNWKRVSQLMHDNLWPIPRALFSVFFTHSLFRWVDQKLSRLEKPFEWSASGTATQVVLLNILISLLDRAAGRSLGSPWTDFASLALLPVLLLPLLRAQKAINHLSGDPLGESNRALTVANVAWLLVGGVLWVLMAAGVLMELGLLPS